ncbi:MAG: metallophosphoesterase [Bacteroidetes bacterium]|nr:metallophosphoesterase [Bacteroidota bacterium]
MIFYTIVRGCQVFASVGNMKTVYLAVMIVLLVAFFAGMFLENQLSPGAANILSFIGYSYLVVLCALFISFLLVDDIRIINHFVPFIGNMPIFRLRAVVLTLIVVGVMMIIGNYTFNHPKIVHLPIQSSRPLKNKKIKIIAISDVHLGVSIEKKRLGEYVKMINSQEPDLVLIAGDLIDRSIKPVINQKMDEELRQIIAPLGVYAVSGNHEYYGEGGDAISDFYRKSNIILLRDSAALINNEFYVIGHEDKTNSHRKELSDILKNTDPSKPTILLDHQPTHLEDAEKNNIDLQLSGHTHNGQIFPGNLIVKNIFELGYGYKQKGNTHYYVSSGLGLWGPQYRVGSQSELVVIDFKY